MRYSGLNDFAMATGRGRLTRGCALARMPITPRIVTASFCEVSQP